MVAFLTLSLMNLESDQYRSPRPSDPVDNPVDPDGELVATVTELGDPRRGTGYEVELMSVEHEVLLPADGGVHDPLAELDVSELAWLVVLAEEVHQELVVIPDGVVHDRFALGELEQALHDIDVLLRVAGLEQPCLLPSPDVDDIAVEVEEIKLVLLKEAVDQLGLGLLASQMKIRDPARSVTHRCTCL
ncbi:MAG: hypothetical protein R3B67_01310 [Phycisphaerales bacterium]